MSDSSRNEDMTGASGGTHTAETKEKRGLSRPVTVMMDMSQLKLLTAVESNDKAHCKRAVNK